MNPLNFLRYVFLSITLLLIYAGCGGGSGSTSNDSLSNTQPLAQNDSTQTDEDTTITINVLDNDTDQDGDSLAVMNFTQPANGAITQVDNGLFTYSPSRDFHGVDRFDYTISDGNGGVTTARVNITVNSVNDPPVADAGSDQEVLLGSLVTLNASRSLDIDSDPLSGAWTLASKPNGSTAFVEGPWRTARFTADRVGNYVFHLVVNDGEVDSAIDIVSISAVSNHVVFTWKAPTTNEDGTELTDLAGYMLYCGSSPGIYTRAYDVGNVTTYTVSNLDAGIHYCAITSYDKNDNESEDSDEVTVTIDAIR